MDLYNTSYNCIYKKEDLFLDSDNLTSENKNLIIEDLYRNDLLNIFFLEEYNEEKLSGKLDKLYIKISSCDFLMDYIKKLMDVYYGHSEDDTFGLIFLLTFDNLYLFHPCICEYLEKSFISDENINNVKSNLIL
jgi:hypothetical protein